MKRFAAALALLLALTGCSTEATGQCFAMDTVISMEIYGSEAEAALSAAQEELQRLSLLLSISGPESEIAQVNRSGGGSVSPETEALVQQALAISKATNGAYDCTVYPAVQAWGWYEKAPAVPEPQTLGQAMDAVDYTSAAVENHRVIFSQPGMGLDLGGIGKGYAAGLLRHQLAEAGISSGLLSLGGNVCAIGKKPNGQPWTVGIADPAVPAQYCCTVAVADEAVVTSGDYQRRFSQNGQTYHHILDPKTGYPVNNGLHSVTIVCKDDTLADGLSTALFVLGPDAGASFWRDGAYSFDAVWIGDDGIQITQGLADRFSCQLPYEVIYR